MKQIQIWPHHVAVAHLDLVLPRARGEQIEVTLGRLARMGLDTRPENVERHDTLVAQ
jgi:hypothetical protein